MRGCAWRQSRQRRDENGSCVRMTRRELAVKSALALGAGLGARRTARAEEPPPKPPAATAYAAEFILNTRFADIPAEVLELARKSILDGIGLALSGSIAESGAIV